MMEQSEKRIREQLLRAEQEAHISDFDMDAAWDRMEQKRNPGRKTRPLFYWSAAAMLLLLCGLPFLWRTTPLPAPEQPIAVSKHPAPESRTVIPVAATDSNGPARLKPEPAHKHVPAVHQKTQTASASQPSPETPETPELAAQTPATKVLAVIPQPKAMPQVSLAELMAEEPAVALPAKSEPAVHIGIRKTIKVKPEDEPGTYVAHHAISIKL